MPKNSKVTKTDGVVRKQRISATLRIGTRKSGQSAHSMTTDALLAVLTNKDHAKSHSAARTVLTRRGVAFEWPGRLDKPVPVTNNDNDCNGCSGPG